MPSKNSLTNLKSNISKEPPILSNVPKKEKRIKRVNKGFQVEEGRAQKWDSFVAHMKHTEDRKKGSDLIDEALDLIFKKYDFS